MADILHPRLFQALGGFYSQACNIQEPTETRDAAGQPVAAWSNLPGHVNLPCRVAPATGGERKSSNQVYLVATHEIGLGGHYPAITSKMRAVVAGQAYNILLVRADPVGATQLVCEVIK